jgi:hypothetical protein
VRHIHTLIVWLGPLASKGLAFRSSSACNNPASDLTRLAAASALLLHSQWSVIRRVSAMLPCSWHTFLAARYPAFLAARSMGRWGRAADSPSPSPSLLFLFHLEPPDAGNHQRPGGWSAVGAAGKPTVRAPCALESRLSPCSSARRARAAFRAGNSAAQAPPSLPLSPQIQVHNHSSAGSSARQCRITSGARAWTPRAQARPRPGGMCSATLRSLGTAVVPCAEHLCAGETVVGDDQWLDKHWINCSISRRGGQVRALAGAWTARGDDIRLHPKSSRLVSR